MKRALGLAFALTLLLATGSHAGPNEDGILVVHGNVDGVDTGGDPCSGIPIPETCEELIPGAIPDGYGVEWFVVIAAGNGLGDGLSFNTITFGIGNYDMQACYIAYYGPCYPELMPLEIPTYDWPGRYQGTAVSWAPHCLSGRVVPIYYFGVYAYGDGIVPLADEYPEQPAAFVSCDQLPEEDPIAGFGTFGYGDAVGQGPDCPEIPVASEVTTWGQIKAIYR